MKFPITHKKQTASFRIVSSMLAIALLWLMPATANTSQDAQTSNNVSNASAAASPADWTQFLRDNMQRWNPYETVLGVGNVGKLQVKWKNPIGGTSGFAFNTSPAVVNGVVYVGSGDGNVYALNASTGAKVWSYKTGGDVFSSPAVANGVVYIGSADGNVYALNAQTGAKLWSYTTFGGSPSVNSSPAVANGVVYVGAESGEVRCAGSAVYALNASTGALLWDFGGGCVSSPAVANGVVYIDIGLFVHALYALNAGTGAELWHLVIPNETAEGHAPGASTPAVANGVVYINSLDGNVFALNAGTGAKLWSFATGAGIFSSPAVANGVVYIGSNNGNVYALNATTGAKLRSLATGFLWLSSPTVVNGVVYIRAGNPNTGEGNVYAFSVGADLFLRIRPTLTTVHQGDLLTYAFPVWNLGPSNADFEVLKTQVPAGTVFDYIRISGTPGLGTCMRPPYLGTGPIVCHENSAMAPNTTWTVRLTVKVTAPPGTVITANAATMADTLDPNLANNMATVRVKVQ